MTMSDVRRQGSGDRWWDLGRGLISRRLRLPQHTHRTPGLPAFRSSTGPHRQSSRLLACDLLFALGLSVLVVFAAGLIGSSDVPRARMAGSRWHRYPARLPALGSSVPAPRCSWWSPTAQPRTPRSRGPSGTRVGWPTTRPGSPSSLGSRSSPTTLRYRALPPWTARIGIPVALINLVGPFAVKMGTGAFSPQGWFAVVVGLTFAVWLLAISVAAWRSTRAPAWSR